ncbi:cation transporter [Paucihalobacter ruber]|uniref:Cation transporter n=1 Tax=Paucihalobacter ruber TaxID=2567861 RepID=A0A506PMX5_9FLAO|nr:cation diffusion facilitator family transporter [Paucihalobacter ruber]TPV34919.1 cation transporter [Paucihalobacter ruber]
MSHSHQHHTGKVNENKLLLAIVLNIGITVAQVIGGFISGSLALLSDALHNFSDVISLLVSYFASKLSRKQASTNKTFGYKRAEILAAFINASTLIIIAVLLIIESVKRFNNPEEINSNLVIWLSALAIAFNGFSVLLLKSSAEKNINMKSAYLHLLTDMLASVAVLIGGLLMKFYEIYWVDSILTLAIALYLIWVGYDLLKTSTKMLMLFTPDHIKVEDIVNRVNSLERVKKLHHVHVWSLNDDELHLEAHVDLNENISVEEFDGVLKSIEKLLSEEFYINHITLQPEYNKQDPKDIIVQD